MDESSWGDLPKNAVFPQFSGFIAGHISNSISLTNTAILEKLVICLYIGQG